MNVAQYRNPSGVGKKAVKIDMYEFEGFCCAESGGLRYRPAVLFPRDTRLTDGIWYSFRVYCHPSNELAVN